MKYFIDFEAAQPSKVITQVGAVSENGDTFFAYIILSREEERQAALTDILGYEVHTPDQMFSDFFDWVLKTGGNKNSAFYTWGWTDKSYIVETMKRCDDAHAKFAATYFQKKLFDYHTPFCKQYGLKSCKLEVAIRAISPSIKQVHNALDDAKLLRLVYTFAQEDRIDPAKLKAPKSNPPAPAKKEAPKKSGVDFSPYPSGTICMIDKDKVIQTFANFNEALLWIAENTKELQSKSFSAIMTELVKRATPQQRKYCGYFWRIAR